MEDFAFVENPFHDKDFLAANAALCIGGVLWMSGVMMPRQQGPIREYSAADLTQVVIPGLEEMLLEG